jgi:UDP-hydrolysing UDP-N-acetyl-D-glucosamine 2-epimerase
MRRIGIVTTARADYGLYRPIEQALKGHPGVEVGYYVTGMHLSPEFGNTVREIEADGAPIWARVEVLLSSDSPLGTVSAMGLTVLQLGQVLASNHPDLLLVLGDRFEMFAAAAAAVPLAIPIAHVHGGEVTFGAMDESFRHAITKISHLHFPSTGAYARRLVQMGEEPWRVTVAGAPGLDAIRDLRPLERKELEDRVGIALAPAPLVVTLHPETLSGEDSGRHAGLLLEALAGRSEPIVFTMPNADAGGRAIADRIRAFVAGRPGAVLVPNLGTHAYVSLMSHAVAMVGNSSSGIIEAPSLGLPVVNIGSRQEGRVRGGNVVDADWSTAAIVQAIERATSPSFRQSLSGTANPYGGGRAGEIIAARLANTPLDRTLLVKRFHDLDAGADTR